MALDIATDSRTAIIPAVARHPEYAEEIAAYIERFPETISGDFPAMTALVGRLKEAGIRMSAASPIGPATRSALRGRDFRSWSSCAISSSPVTKALALKPASNSSWPVGAAAFFSKRRRVHRRSSAQRRSRPLLRHDRHPSSCSSETDEVAELQVLGLPA